MRLLKTLFGHSAFCFAVAAASFTLTPTAASAASFEIDFCVVNADECTEDNLTEASLLFEEILGGDHNDYTLTMTMTGTGTDTIDQVAFSINGVQTPDGYETKPTVSGPGGGWVAYFDGVSNSSSCTSDTNNSQAVCANSAGGGPSVNGTNVWTWFVDLDDSLASISAITAVNFRAHFLTAAGGPGGNFSPGGGLLQTGTTTTTTTTTPTSTSTTPSTGTPSGAAPEPTVMTLLGAGLVLAGRRLRRRKTA
jgi:hypothetical protein